MEVTSEILSQNCTYLAVYIKLDPTHARHSNTSARHAIISMLMGVLNYKEEEDRELHSPNTLFTMVPKHVIHYGPRPRFPFYKRTSPSRGHPLSTTWGRPRQGCEWVLTLGILTTPRKIGKNMIFWRKIVIFHTKYPKNFRASLRSAQFFYVRPPLLTWNPWSAPDSYLLF